MSERSPRPAAVWIAVFVNFFVGLAVLAFTGVVVYALVTVEPRELSVKEAVIMVGFFAVPLVCFAGAILALMRFRFARLLPIISVVIMLLFIIDIFLDIESFEFNEIGVAVIGLVLFLVAVLFFIAIPGILLSFGKSVNAYFGVSSKDKDQQLLEPPPPPSSFS